MAVQPLRTDEPMTKVTRIQFTAPVTLFQNHGVSQITPAQYGIQDFPKSRYVILRSNDERMGKKYVVIPYEAIRAIDLEETDDV